MVNIRGSCLGMSVILVTEIKVYKPATNAKKLRQMLLQTGSSWKKRAVHVQCFHRLFSQQIQFPAEVASARTLISLLKIPPFIVGLSHLCITTISQVFHLSIDKMDGIYHHGLSAWAMQEIFIVYLWAKWLTSLYSMASDDTSTQNKCHACRQPNTLNAVILFMPCST